jgi:hypothetical protein
MDRKRLVVRARFSSYLLSTYPNAQTTQLISSLLQGNALLTAAFCHRLMSHQDYTPNKDTFLRLTNTLSNLDRPIILTEMHLTGAGFYSRPTPAILTRVFLVFPQYVPRKDWTINYHMPFPSTTLRNHHPTNLLPETVTTFLNTLSIAT